MRLHPISNKIIFPIYFDGTSKNDYRDAMYVLNNGMYHIYVYFQYVQFENNQYEFTLIDCLQFGCIGIVHMRSHRMHLHPISDKIIFAIYFDGTSKNDTMVTVSQLWSYNLSVNTKERILL